jgi:DNA-binding beta-propeller fold protein YncE
MFAVSMLPLDDHYLISAHLGAGQTDVIDLGTNKVVATIRDTPGAEGVDYVPDFIRRTLVTTRSASWT